MKCANNHSNSIVRISVSTGLTIKKDFLVSIQGASDNNIIPSKIIQVEKIIIRDGFGYYYFLKKVGSLTVSNSLSLNKLVLFSYNRSNQSLRILYSLYPIHCTRGITNSLCYDNPDLLLRNF